MKFRIFWFSVFYFLSLQAFSQNDAQNDSQVQSSAENLKLKEDNKEIAQSKGMNKASFPESEKQSQEESSPEKLMKSSSNQSPKKNLSSQKTTSSQFHSFSPLLIKGGKKIKNNTKNIKVDINSISETEVFFIETDFKKRIYLGEGYL